jgi:hypothetical protein
LISHDDILIKTPDFYKKTLKEIEGKEKEVGWVTFTNDHYYSIHASISVRGSFHKDRMSNKGFECHRGPGNKKDYPKRAVKVYGPYSHFNLISTAAMAKIGPCVDWTPYTILVDEDWCLESLSKGLINVWVPDIIYEHPSPINARNRKSDLRFEEQAHQRFVKKWGFDFPYSQDVINKFVGKYPHLSFLTGYSYEWHYLKEE